MAAEPIHIRIPDQKRPKFKPKTDICTFIGYVINQKGYVLERESDGVTITLRDAKFDEAYLSHRHPPSTHDDHHGTEELNDTTPQLPALTSNMHIDDAAKAPEPSELTAHDPHGDPLSKKDNEPNDHHDKRVPNLIPTALKLQTSRSSKLQTSKSSLPRY